MQVFTVCGQSNSYAGDTIQCDGNVHELTITLSDGFTTFDNQIVCEAHMPTYKELGAHPARGFTITGDEIIGEIGSVSKEGQTGALSTKEAE